MNMYTVSIVPGTIGWQTHDGRFVYHRETPDKHTQWGVRARMLEADHNALVTNGFGTDFEGILYVFNSLREAQDAVATLPNPPSRRLYRIGAIYQIDELGVYIHKQSWGIDEGEVVWVFERHRENKHVVRSLVEGADAATKEAVGLSWRDLSQREFPTRKALLYAVEVWVADVRIQIRALSKQENS